MHTRIKELRQHFNMTQQEFADRIHVERSSIAGYENGKRVPRDATIELICREFGVNETWLRTGEGEMTVSSTRDEEIASFFGRVLVEEESSFKRRLVAAFARMPESHWEILADIAERIAAEPTEKPEE